jgi:L-asparaginase
MHTSTLRLIVTGGTFDKQYDELNGTLAFGSTHVEDVLRRGRSDVALVVEVLMLKDSLDLTDDDRARIVASARASEERRIVVTHGTDTMVESARALAAADLEKTIVLTGAMIPYVFGSSDGLFNLGSALSFAQVLPPGVYVAMNGRVFPWDNVRKNRERGVFEPIR